MKHHEGAVGRLVRACLGLLPIGPAATQVGGPWPYAIGAVPLRTAAFGIGAACKLLVLTPRPITRR